MAKTLQFRRGNTSQTLANTMAAGEIFVNTDQNTIVVGDGSTVGGTPLSTQAHLTANVSLIRGIQNSQNTNITSVNQYAASAYALANTHTSSLTAINQFAQSAYNKANTASGGGGGGGGPSTSFVNTPDTVSYVSLGNPTAVNYIPASNTVQAGTLTVGGGNTTSDLISSGAQYVDVGYWSGASMPNPYSYTKGVTGVVFTKNSGFDSVTLAKINSLSPGSKFSIMFVAGTSSSEMDQFYVTFTVSTLGVMDSTAVNTATGGYWPGTQPDRIAGSYSWSSSWAGKSPTVWVNNYIVQPYYNNSTSSQNAQNTPLVGLRTGHPIHNRYLYNWNGQGMLDISMIFTDSTHSTSNNQRMGVVYVSFPNDPVTVVTVPSNLYNTVTTLANTITFNNSLTSITSPIKVYDATNNKISISSSDLTGSITTSTPIQTYTALEYAPSLQLGKSLSVYEEANQNRVLLSGNLYKVQGLKTFGTITGQSFANNVINFSGTDAPIETYDYSAYPNGIYFYPGSYKNFRLINLDSSIYNLISANNSLVNVSYYRTGSSSIYNLNLQVINQGTNGISCDGYWGSSMAKGNWVQLNLLNFTVGTTSYANTSYSYDYNDGNYTNVIVKVPANCVSFSVSSNTISNLLSYNPSKISVQGIESGCTIDSANNIVISTLPTSTYGGDVFTGSTIASVSQASQLATVTDIANNLPSWIASAGSDTHSTSSSYAITGGSGGLGLRQFNINNVMPTTSWQFNTQTKFYSTDINGIGLATAASAGWDFNRWVPFNKGTLLSYSAGFSESVWTDSLYANTALTTKGVLSGTTLTSNKSYTDQLIVSPQGYCEPDPYINNVAVLLTGRTGNDPYTIINDAPRGGQVISSSSGGGQTSYTNLNIVPPGAPDWARSVMIGDYDFTNSGYSYGGAVAFQNVNGFDLENPSVDYTVETWVSVPGQYVNVNVLYGDFHGTNQDFGTGATVFQQQFPFYSYVSLNNTSVLNAYASPSNQSTGYGYIPWPWQWYHLVWTYSASDQRITSFINGYCVASSPSATWTSPGSPITAFPISTLGPNVAHVFYNYRITDGINRYPISGTVTTNRKYFQPSVLPYGTSANTEMVAISNTAPSSAIIQGSIRIKDITGAPTTTANSGGVLYTQNGNLYYKGPNGTITQIAGS